jgi:hypothetical protein
MNSVRPTICLCDISSTNANRSRKITTNAEPPTIILARRRPKRQADRALTPRIKDCNTKLHIASPLVINL